MKKGTGAAFVMACLLVTLAAQETFSPARYRRRSVPALPELSARVGGGQVFLEVAVSSSGDVVAVFVNWGR